MDERNAEEVNVEMPANQLVAGRRVIALGERDGVSGAAIAAVVEATGGQVVLSATECFV